MIRLTGSTGGHKKPMGYCQSDRAIGSRGCEDSALISAIRAAEFVAGATGRSAREAAWDSQAVTASGRETVDAALGVAQRTVLPTGWLMTRQLCRGHF